MLQANLWSRVAKYPVQPQSTHEGALRLLLLPNERKIKPPDWWINLDIPQLALLLGSQVPD